MYKKRKTNFLRTINVVLISVFLSACVSTQPAPTIKLSKKKPKSERALLHTQLARSYMVQEQYATAKEELEKALTLDSSHSDSNYVMGLLMIRLKNNNDAEYYLKRAVSSDEKNSSAAHDFGVFLCQIGKQKEAIKYFKLAVSNRLFDRPELSYMRAGECLAKIKDPEAEAYLRRALDIDPLSRPALYQLAILKKDNGQTLSARAYIERYLAITKPQPDALLLAFQIESTLKAFDVAEMYRKQILEDFPGSNAAEIVRDATGGI